MKQLSSSVKVIVMGLSFLFMLGLIVYAQTGATSGDACKGPNVSADKKAVELEGMRLLRLAVELIEYARQNESPETMLTAVQILRRVPLRPMEVKPPEAKGEQAEEEKGEEGAGLAITLNPDELLKEAMSWAEKQKKDEVKTLLAEEASAKPAGVQTLGPAGGLILLTDQKAAARNIVKYQVVFNALEPAAALVVGDGDTDLDLVVRDENGNIIASDTKNIDTCYCEWTPIWTGKFYIEVINLGNKRNTFTLIMATPQEIDTIVTSILTDIIINELMQK